MNRLQQGDIYIECLALDHGEAIKKLEKLDGSKKMIDLSSTYNVIAAKKSRMTLGMRI